MAAGFALQLAVNNFVLSVCRAVQTCESSSTLATILRSLNTFAHLAAKGGTLPETEDANVASPLAQSRAHLIDECRRTEGYSTILTSLLSRQLETVNHSLLPGNKQAPGQAHAWQAAYLFSSYI